MPLAASPIMSRGCATTPAATVFMQPRHRRPTRPWRSKGSEHRRRRSTRCWSAFRAKFHVEPDHQCSTHRTDPMRGHQSSAILDEHERGRKAASLRSTRHRCRTVRRSSGTLETHGGLISSVFLIDHKGMAFNLDDRVVVQAGKATFSIPIGLGAADKAAGKAVPQIIMVITGPAGHPGRGVLHSGAGLGAAAQESSMRSERRAPSSPRPPSISGSAGSMDADGTPPPAFVLPARSPAQKAA